MTDLTVIPLDLLVAEIRRRDHGNDRIKVDEIDALLDTMTLGELGMLRRRVNALYTHKAQYHQGLTPDEWGFLERKDFIGCIKAVRERTGLGLADAKEFVDQWKLQP